MNNSFIHLHLHSEYSISDSLIRIKDLLLEASEKEFPAIAITDINNMYLHNKDLSIQLIDNNSFWLDAGTIESLFEASSIVKTLRDKKINFF